MSAGQLALVVATILCTIGFAGLCIVLLRVLDALGALRAEVASLSAETRPLLDELRSSVEAARDDLDRFDRVLGSAEAISSGVESAGGLVARAALSAPVIKTVALASGTGRAARRLRGRRDTERAGGRATRSGRDTVDARPEDVAEARRGRRRAR